MQDKLLLITRGQQERVSFFFIVTSNGYGYDLAGNCGHLNLIAAKYTNLDEIRLNIYLYSLMKCQTKIINFLRYQLFYCPINFKF